MDWKDRRQPEPLLQGQDGNLARSEETAARLSILKEVPSCSPEAVAAARRALLARAALLRGQQNHDHPSHYWTRQLGFALIIFLVVASLALAADLSQRALPSTHLYSIKLVLEDARITLTHDPQDRAELALNLIDTRVEEMLQLVQAGQPIPPDLLSRLQDQLQLCLDDAALLTDVQMADLLARLRQRAQERARALRQTLAADPIQEPLEKALGLLDEANRWAALGLNDPTRFRQERGQDRPSPTPNPGPGRPTTALPTPTPPASLTPIPTGTPPHSPEQYQYRQEDPTPQQTRGADRNNNLEPTPTPVPSRTARPTHTPRPAHTLKPTHTPKLVQPTREPKPSHTPKEANTPKPTKTPK